MAVTWMIFYNASDRNLDFFGKIYIFSETIISGRTYYAIWGINPVSRIN